MRHWKFVLAISTSLTGPAFSQEGPVIELEPIVIQGSKGDRVVTTTAGDVDGYRALTATSATLTETPLRQVPQSIEVVPRNILDDQGVTSIGDALKNVSGTVGQSALQTPVYNSNYIRGFIAEQYLDGMATYLTSGDPNSFADVERIEVLKGPNSILYGGGSGTPLGGVINVISKLPTADRFFEIGGTVGSEGYYAPYFDINQPLNNEGTVLFRGTGTYVRSGSEIDVIDTKRYSINPTLTLTNNADTTFTLQGRISRWEQPEYQGLPAWGTIAGPFRVDRDLFIGDPNVPDSHSETKSITATLEHEFNDTWSSSTKLRYGQSSYSQLSQLIISNTPDAGGSSWSLHNTNIEEDRKEFSISSHLQAKFSSGVFENNLLLGADYSRISETNNVFFSGPIGTINLDAPDMWPPFARPFEETSDADNVYRTLGAYAQLQSTAADRLHLLAGVRIARLEIDQSSSIKLRSDYTGKTKLLPRIGAVFDLTDQLSAFASYSEGMRGNPFYFYSGTAAPETSKQYEAGFKFDLDYGLSGSAAVFQIERSNVPVPDPSDPYGLTNLAIGQQRSRGFDTELTWQPDDHWKVMANYAYVDAELTKDIPGGAQSGNKLNNVPRHSGGLWVDYTFGDDVLKGWSTGAGLHAASGAPVDLANTYRTESYVTADAAIRYKHNGFSANLAVKNLTDEKYYLPYTYLIGGVAAAQGRSFYLTVSQRF
ncbi:iron complex outermembrane receptor protein [Phyllobacterium myrsinacearum]|uniref:TonB-dependent siderophore receptor n=1 Tax=Phyllobacterium myrsinacearum TaxID=28101 RepID=A0A2S9JPA5_9HYPH|nr:TonB-dependent siderophore receptor [Phyllobacterium myrsinacearum]PWV90424.1 iron complex outermembrane receptor protein [Phyllobacterium myrsinacearum]RZV05382.1 iron complex outermembrane receptor protein [Phyllobacterium myrsinacearum]